MQKEHCWQFPQEKLLENSQELQSSHFLQVGGVVIASDGVRRHSPLDIINVPFCGGWKLLLKDKILNPNLLLANGEFLIEPAIKAMFDAKSVSDVVIVTSEEQNEELTTIVSKYSNGKPYKVISSSGRIGEAVAEGADNISQAGYFFAILPDLPYANGQAVDLAVTDILKESIDTADLYLPVVSADFFHNRGDDWNSTFTKYREGKERKQLKGLNFFIANSRTVNPTAMQNYYDIRAIHSLKGKINAIRHFPFLLTRVALQYLVSKLSMTTLEEIGSELYGGKLKVVELYDPSYVAFMKDIDTSSDYKAYKIENATKKVD